MKIKPYDYAPVGERVKNARVMRELTQEQVANYIGVNSKHLSSVERGERGLSFSSLMDLCKFLDIDADYILFGTITRDNNNPFNKLLLQMTPEQSQYAEELIKVYAKSCGIFIK